MTKLNNKKTNEQTTNRKMKKGTGLIHQYVKKRKIKIIYVYRAGGMICSMVYLLVFFLFHVSIFHFCFFCVCLILCEINVMYAIATFCDDNHGLFSFGHLFIIYIRVGIESRNEKEKTSPNENEANE